MIPLDAEAGDLVFFSYLTMPESRPNRSPQPRKSVLLQLHGGQDRTIATGHPDSALVRRGWNHHMERERADGA